MISLDTIKSIALSGHEDAAGDYRRAGRCEQGGKRCGHNRQDECASGYQHSRSFEEMQLAVKKAVEGSSGITVRNVQVIVEDISEPEGNKPAVSSKP